MTKAVLQQSRVRAAHCCTTVPRARGALVVKIQFYFISKSRASLKIVMSALGAWLTECKNRSVQHNTRILSTVPRSNSKAQKMLRVGPKAEKQ